jgi:antitoxin PrlF
MANATVTSKGQVTIPKRILDHLRIEPGDLDDFIVDADGRVVVRAATADIGELKGLLRKKRRPVSLEEMDQAISRQHSPKS